MYWPIRCDESGQKLVKNFTKGHAQLKWFEAIAPKKNQPSRTDNNEKSNNDNEEEDNRKIYLYRTLGLKVKHE